MKAPQLGIVEHSYSQAWGRKATGKFHDALTFLEYCASIGAGGVQVAIRGEEQAKAGKIRARAEELGMWFEGNLSLPKTSADLAAFEASAKAAMEAGAKVARLACLGGRRYETFKTAEAFRTFKENSFKSLTLIEPVLKKLKLKLGVENHKDWFAEEEVDILRRLSSEWIGACIDTGNNFSLLENIYEMVEALAPFAVSSHLKDMGVQEYADGFLLSEVPLGEGCLDLKRIVGLLRKHNSGARLNLEMMTRDPLKIPCLTDGYYATFPEANAKKLAAQLAFVKSHATAELPHITGRSPEDALAFEDENVRKCVDWAAKNLV